MPRTVKNGVDQIGVLFQNQESLELSNSGGQQPRLGHTITSSIGDANPNILKAVGLHDDHPDHDSQGIVNIGDSNFNQPR